MSEGNVPTKLSKNLNNRFVCLFKILIIKIYLGLFTQYLIAAPVQSESEISSLAKAIRESPRYVQYKGGGRAFFRVFELYYPIPNQGRPPVPEEIQSALRDYLTTVTVSKEARVQHYCGNGELAEDQPIETAIRFGNPSTDLLGKVMAVETVNDVTRSDIVMKLKDRKAFDALDKVARKYMHDSDREKRWVAAQAFMSRENYTTETAKYLIDEVTSGKSPRTELLFHFEEPVNALYRNADENDRIRLREFAKAKGWNHLTEKSF